MIEVRPQAAEERGLSAEGLAEAGAAIERDVAEQRVAGAVALLARDGEVLSLEVHGAADREAGRPMREDTIFRVYSMTKPLTSVALMALVEEGRLGLDDPVARWLPEFAAAELVVQELDAVEYGRRGLEAVVDGEPLPTGEREFRLEPAAQAMTARDLLRHTSGLPYGWFARPEADRLHREYDLLNSDRSLTETIAGLAALPLKHPPGTTWEYGTSTDVLGRLIEVVSGRRFSDFLRARVLEPLGMVDTDFHVPPDEQARFAQLYTPIAAGGLRPLSSPESTRWLVPPVFESGGSGLVSTAADYLRFCEMMRRGGALDGARILASGTVDEMFRDQLREVTRGRGTRGDSFGLGFSVVVEPELTGVATTVGECHWGGVAGTRFWIDRAEGLVGLYLTQVLPHTGLSFGHDFKRRSYAALRERRGAPRPASGSAE